MGTKPQPIGGSSGQMAGWKQTIGGRSWGSSNLAGKGPKVVMEEDTVGGVGPARTGAHTSGLKVATKTGLQGNLMETPSRSTRTQPSAMELRRMLHSSSSSKLISSM